jgi:hypothetical protein
LDISDKNERVSPFIADDLGLMDDFVYPGTQNDPRSQNHPRKAAAEHRDV